MGDGINTPLSIDDFIPVTGKNYIAPHKRTIPTGTRYVDFKYPRPVMLIPQSPTTVGICYAYPAASPSDDGSSIPIPAGNMIYLDARGEWYVRTSSSADEVFLVIDMGSAANAAAAAQALSGGTGAAAIANRGGGFSATKTVAIPSTAEQCASQAIPNGFAVVVKALPTNTDRVGVGFSAAAADLVTGTPCVLEPGASVRYYITNTNLLWIDSIVAAEGVCLTGEI